jgi:hypothetical protein
VEHPKSYLIKHIPAEDETIRLRSRREMFDPDKKEGEKGESVL